MADLQAKVSAIEVLERFRAALIIFMDAAHRSLDEVGDDARKMRQWLQHDQRMHWQMELRKRIKKLDLVNQELFSARLSKLHDTLMVKEAAVRRAKEAVHEAEEKQRRVKYWSHNFDHLSDPLLKRMEGLRSFLTHDLPKAISFLVQAQKTLESYTQMAPPPGGAPQISSQEKP